MKLAHGIILHVRRVEPDGVIADDPELHLADYRDAADELLDYELPQLMGEPEPLL